MVMDRISLVGGVATHEPGGGGVLGGFELISFG
jgi:hypothetical protein